MRRIIIYLIRKRLGLKKGEHFRFTNQASPYNTYYFTDEAVMKHTRYGDRESTVSLNWLLDDNCTIEKVKE